MLFYENLEDIIFSRHENLSDIPDELIIISGYLGPAPMERLNELNFKVTVIGGMYPTGMKKRLWNSLEKIKKENKDLKLFFSKTEIHSKIYMWRKNEKILGALIGSANFSSNGLRTDYRESLAEVTNDSFNPLINYFKLIKENSTETPYLAQCDDTISLEGYQSPDFDELKYSCELPLYSLRSKQVSEKSGLNWGLADGHVAEGDAYITLTKEIIKNNPHLFHPYDDEYISPTRRSRNSDPIEIIWDDGFVMAASFEGTQEIDEKRYPKQIASYSAELPVLNGEKISKKSILGRYLRKRLNVSINHKITLKDLKKYGRTSITFSLIEPGIYYADFSI